MTTTLHTITDEQIQTLRDEQDGGDLLMAAICDRALGQLDDHRAAQYGARQSGEIRARAQREIRPALAMTVDEARAECARVIAAAGAMATTEQPIGYTTHGSVRGQCGHRHQTAEAAERCLAKDAAGCATQGGYSDRRVVEIGSDRLLYIDVSAGEWVPGLGGRTSGAARFEGR